MLVRNNNQQPVSTIHIDEQSDRIENDSKPRHSLNKPWLSPMCNLQRSMAQRSHSCLYPWYDPHAQQHSRSTRSSEQRLKSDRYDWNQTGMTEVRQVCVKLLNRRIQCRHPAVIAKCKFQDCWTLKPQHKNSLNNNDQSFINWYKVCTQQIWLKIKKHQKQKYIEPQW